MSLLEKDVPNIITESQFLLSNVRKDLVTKAIENRSIDVFVPVNIMRDILDMGIFEDGVLLKCEIVYTPSSKTYIQLYKFNLYYVIVSTVIENDSNGINSFQNALNDSVHWIVAGHQTNDLEFTTWKSTIMSFFSNVVSKASVHENLYFANEEIKRQVKL